VATGRWIDWVKKSLPLVAAAVIAFPLHAAVAPSLSTARQQYGDAMSAMDRGQWTEYEQLRPALDDYPLAIYLDYFNLTRHASAIRPADANRFLHNSANSPLPNRFLAIYLKSAGRERRWDDFLAVMPQEPNDVSLKCYYFRARLARGDKGVAWEGAQRLWVYGRSRPDVCDPLFDAWLKSGALTDDVVWARLLQAFDARQRSLMQYVARQGSDALKPWSDKLLAIYRKPDRLRSHSLPVSSPYSADIAARGLAYLARFNPAEALVQWHHYQGVLEFTAEQARAVDYAIALQSLFAETEANKAWLTGALERLGEDKLVELRLRWALAEQDWPALAAHLPRLSIAGRQDSGWRYWQAIADEKSGKPKRAREQLLALAGERGYYSFLAADKLGRSYAFNHQPLLLEASAHEPLKQLPAVRRVEELYYHREANLAHSEWFKMLQDTDDEAERRELASLAHEQGWYRLAIDAANKAKAWDQLDLRFPIAYQDTFAHYASQQQVPSTELMAIARRESAFFPEARSPVGARGLMQIMPATGKQVASKLGRKHQSADLYQVDNNVLLGSAYYRQLLDRFDGNRVFALAAYNAGPHRVDRWRKASATTLPVELWIETIPYRETRNYVQAVLSYNVVFQYLIGKPDGLLSPAERALVY
jgi:soluble lytic murein transglycosylase